MSRIAMLAHSTNPRGGVVHAMQLCEALTDLGHEVVLHAPDASGQGFFRRAACELRPFRVGPAPRDLCASVEQRIADYVGHFSLPANRGFDLYHAHDGISGNALATLRDQGRIPGYLRTVHHIDAFADARIERLQARSIREASAWMTVSALWRDRLCEDFGVAAAICGNGVDRERFRPERDGGEPALRARLGLGYGPLFLVVGGVEARKNTARILDAFAEVSAIRPDAELVIAGGASLLDHDAYQQDFARQLAAHGSLARRVRRIGVVADADMPGLYRLAAALVFASVIEGFGLCVLEAMACGTPVIASAIEPFVSYLEPRDALWCDPHSAKTIADAMALCLRDEVAGPLRERGRKVAARFGWRAVAQAHAPSYAQLLELADA